MQDTINTDLPFSFVPHWVTDSDISDRALRLYSVLAKFADSKTGQAFPGRTRLSRELKCSPKSVDRAVKELENIGAVRKTQRVKDGRYQSSLYTVVRVDPKTHQTRPRVTHDATPGHGWDDPVSPVTQRTITTELKPKELEPLKKRKPKSADEYEPSQAIVEEMETRYIGLSLEIELEKFKDHHAAKGSQFKDWDRAFRGWLRRAQEWSPAAKQARAWAEYEKQMEKEDPDAW